MLLAPLRTFTHTTIKMHNQTIASSSSSSLFKKFFLLLVFTLVIAHLHQHEVEAKPLNVNQVRFRRLPPREFSAALGSSITIECEAGGSPPPSIYWLKNGKRIVQVSGLSDDSS